MVCKGDKKIQNKYIILYFTTYYIFFLLLIEYKKVLFLSLVLVLFVSAKTTTLWGIAMDSDTEGVSIDASVVDTSNGNVDPKITVFSNWKYLFFIFF